MRAAPTGKGAKFGIEYPPLTPRSSVPVYSDDGRLIGAGTVIHAANDAEAIVQAEATRGACAADLPAEWSRQYAILGLST